MLSYKIKSSWYLSCGTPTWLMYNVKKWKQSRGKIPNPEQFGTDKPELWDELYVSPKLPDFIGSQSWLLFPMSCRYCIAQEVSQCYTGQECTRMDNFLRDLSVVNDGAESCVKAISEYANLTWLCIQRRYIYLWLYTHIKMHSKSWEWMPL